MNLPPEQVLFTTTQTAKVLGLSVRTVIKASDSGHLRSVMIPDSRDRRFHREAIYAFAREHHWPLYGVTMTRHILTIGMAASEFRELFDALPHDGQYQLIEAKNGFDAGRLVMQHVYDASIIDSAIGKPESIGMAQAMRALSHCGVRRLIYLATDDDGELCPGFDCTIQKPAHMKKLIDVITTEPAKPKRIRRKAKPCS